LNLLLIPLLHILSTICILCTKGASTSSLNRLGSWFPSLSGCYFCVSWRDAVVLVGLRVLVNSHFPTHDSPVTRPLRSTSSFIPTHPSRVTLRLASPIFRFVFAAYLAARSRSGSSSCTFCCLRPPLAFDLRGLVNSNLFPLARIHLGAVGSFFLPLKPTVHALTTTTHLHTFSATQVPTMSGVHVYHGAIHQAIRRCFRNTLRL
jgi:hypothetical protein